MGELTKEHLDELIAHHSHDCSVLLYGKCSTRSCLVRGGWKQGDPDFSTATCVALETVGVLRSALAGAK